MENQHQKITGYRDLSQEEIDAMNRIKELGQQVNDLIVELTASASGSTPLKPDARWLAIAKTELQKGFMFLTRAVAKPESF